MTADAFNTLVKQMVPLSGDLCPNKGQLVNPFNNNIMPDLSCPVSRVGGKRRTKKTKKKSKRSKKTKKRKTH